VLPGLQRRRLPRPHLRQPAQLIVAGFATGVAVGTILLLLPVSRTSPDGAPFMTSLFTATSSVCVTGLTVVDTPGYWSTFGEMVILGLIQVGGLGTMTLATLVGLVISRRLGLASRLTAAAETKTAGLGDVRAVLLGVVRVSLVIELLTAIPLTLRFALAYDESPGRAIYLGVFHSVSAFNNAGFALWSDNLIGFATDPWICLPIAAAVIVGGLGFPVLFEIRRHLHAGGVWSVHTRLTVVTTLVLLVTSTLFVTAAEWDNDGTLGTFSAPGRVLVGFFQAVVLRTAGFNSVDIGQADEATWLAMIVFMFIGGGSASTAGGIKVTTFALLFVVIWAEVRGQRDVTAFHRRVDPRVHRQALTVALLSVAAVVAGTFVIVLLSDFPLSPVLFEVTSAFATVGLTTGITADLPTSAHLILTLLMFLGRVGPITLVSALALRERPLRYQLPEGRPLIG